MRLSNGFQACLAETRIKFALIHSITRREPNQRRTQQAPENTDGRKHKQAPNNSLDSGSHLVLRLWHLSRNEEPPEFINRPVAGKLHRAACIRYLWIRTSGGPLQTGVLQTLTRT